MLAVEGFYDGECVRLKEKVNTKNQRVAVVFTEELMTMNAGNSSEGVDSKDAFLEALLTDKYVSKETTNYDVDAFIRESRGYE